MAVIFSLRSVGSFSASADLLVEVEQGRKKRTGKGMGETWVEQ